MGWPVGWAGEGVWENQCRWSAANAKEVIQSQPGRPSTGETDNLSHCYSPMRCLFPHPGHWMMTTPFS